MYCHGITQDPSHNEKAEYYVQIGAVTVFFCDSCVTTALLDGHAELADYHPMYKKREETNPSDEKDSA